MWVRIVGTMSPKAHRLAHPPARKHGHRAGSSTRSSFEEQGNHNTVAGCNVHILKWFKSSFAGWRAVPVDVLDVGGGQGSLGVLVRSAVPAVPLTWDCIDVTPSSSCGGFNGRTLPRSNSSKDVVVFNFVLHHAADKTISLLKEALRVSRRYVVVAEDLKGGGDAAPLTRTQAAQLARHEWLGTFRGGEEWHALFGVLGLRVVHEASPSAACAGSYVVPRALYVLEVPPRPLRAADGQQRRRLSEADQLADGPSDSSASRSEWGEAAAFGLVESAGDFGSGSSICDGPLSAEACPSQCVWCVEARLCAAHFSDCLPPAHGPDEGSSSSVGLLLAVGLLVAWILSSCRQQSRPKSAAITSDEHGYHDEHGYQVELGAIGEDPVPLNSLAAAESQTLLPDQGQLLLDRSCGSFR